MRMFDRLQKVFQEVFDNQRLRIDINVTQDNIPGWDSMAHVNLCLALEEEFCIQLTVKEMATITSIKAIKEVIDRHIEQ